MLTVTGCTDRTYTIDGTEYQPKKVDTDAKQCHDCGALNGEYHHPGCDMETCPKCGGQLISCPHGRQAIGENAL